MAGRLLGMTDRAGHQVAQTSKGLCVIRTVFTEKGLSISCNVTPKSEQTMGELIEVSTDNFHNVNHEMGSQTLKYDRPCSTPSS